MTKLKSRLLVLLGIMLLVSIPQYSFGSDQPDEFETFDTTRKVSTTDEFAAFDTTKTSVKCATVGECKTENAKENVIWILEILFFTIIAGILVRFKTTRNLRGLFLLASVAFIGFYKGGCPCPILGIQNLTLMLVGVKIYWGSIVYLPGLIIITYFFGKVWCVWICQLGAIQELIHLPGGIKILQSQKSQKIMRYIRIVLLIVLVSQLIITKTAIYEHYDPFKAIYNLIAANTITLILLILVLLSSIFIYRPFCKVACPIGLILGWVSKIPGASIIGNNDSCTSCINCNSVCKIRAITKDNKISVLDNQECIACGDCLNSCKKISLKFYRKGENHHDIFECKSKT